MVSGDGTILIYHSSYQETSKMSDDRFYETYEEAVLEIHTPKLSSSLSSNGYHATSHHPKIYTYKSVLSLLWSLFEISLTVLIPFLIIFGVVASTVLIFTTIQWHTTNIILLFHNKLIFSSAILISIAIFVTILVVVLTRISNIRSNDTPQKPDGSAITAGTTSIQHYITEVLNKL